MSKRKVIVLLVLLGVVLWVLRHRGDTTTD